MLKEKGLYYSREKVVRILISPKKRNFNLGANKVVNPAFLLDTALNIADLHKEYRQVSSVKEQVIHKLQIHFLDVRKKRARNDFEEEIDR